MNANASLLREHPLFGGLSSRALSRLTAGAAVLEFPKGGTVVREGDPGDALYLVLSGRCRATLREPQGGERLCAVYAPGDTFGARALLGLDRFRHTIRVVTDCVLLRLRGDDAREVVMRGGRSGRGLERRWEGEADRAAAGARADKLGRVAVVCSLAPAADGEAVVANVCAALRAETGRSVLQVSLVRGELSPALLDWRRVAAPTARVLQRMAAVRKVESGHWSVTIHASGHDGEAACVAPLLSHLARFARYVVVHVDGAVPDAVAAPLLVQSDLPYVLVQRGVADLERARRLLRPFADQPLHELASPRLLLMHKPGERARAYDLALRACGPVRHAFLPPLPGVTSPVDAYVRRCPHGVFSEAIRSLAREVGHMRVGLALSAGGAKSLAHIGVLQVLEEAGLEVDVVAGTSMGALIGALWCHGLDGDALEALARRQESAWGLWRLVDPVFPPRRGFIGGMRARELVAEVMGDGTFAELRRPMHVVATDLETLERVVFADGEVAPAVHASMAIPGVVVPVRWAGRTLVDGGVAEPVPVDVLLERGVERVIAVNTIPTPGEMKAYRPLEGRGDGRAARGSAWAVPNRYLNYFARGNILDVWGRSMLGAEGRLAEGACRRADLVIRPVSCDGRWHDFTHPRKHIELGRRVAEEQLALIRRMAA